MAWTPSLQTQRRIYVSEINTLISNNGKITREELAQVPTPLGTTSHRLVPHHEIVEALVETLSFRHIGIVGEEYAVSTDGMRMFGVLDLEAAFEGCRFAIGLRNSHDKSFRLNCDSGAQSGGFQPLYSRQCHAAGVDCRHNRWAPE
jgi:hypothetical protein